MAEPFLNSMSANSGDPIFLDPTLRQFDVLPSDSLSEFAGAFPEGHSSGFDFKDSFLQPAVQCDPVEASVTPTCTIPSQESKENIKPVVVQANDIQGVMLDPVTDLPMAGMKQETEAKVMLVNEPTSHGDQQHGALLCKTEGDLIAGTTKQASDVTQAAGDAGLESEVGSSEYANEESQPQNELDIVISNVVCTFSTKCHINLRRLATEGVNVIYKRENGMVNMKLRHPYSTASIWASGKITVTGATSEELSHLAAKRIARKLQLVGFRTRFCNFRVVNVLATCSLPFAIRITHFSRDHPRNSSYEPEIHPGVTYRIPHPKATLKIFSTGSITVTAPCVANVQTAVEHIFPLVWEYRMEKREVVKHERQTTLGYLAHQCESTASFSMDKQSFRYKRQKRQMLDNETDSDTSEDDLDSSEESDC